VLQVRPGGYGTSVFRELQVKLGGNWVLSGLVLGAIGASQGNFPEGMVSRELRWALEDKG